MVSKIDDSVGAIVTALEQKGILENSVIIFMSDNGAPTVGEFRNWGSNYPLKGLKGTLWEGGIRSPSFISSQLFLQKGRISNDLIHVTDWLPTLLSAANGDVNFLNLDIDGADIWPSLVYNFDTIRRSTLLNIDEKNRNAALILSNFKLIVGKLMIKVIVITTYHLYNSKNKKFPYLQQIENYIQYLYKRILSEVIEFQNSEV